MKVIDLTKESFVEKVAEFQEYPNKWILKVINLAWWIFMLPGVYIAKPCHLYSTNWL